MRLATEQWERERQVKKQERQAKEQERQAKEQERQAKEQERQAKEREEAPRRRLEAEKQIRELYSRKITPSPEAVEEMATQCRFCGDRATVEPRALEAALRIGWLSSEWREYLVPVCTACYEKVKRKAHLWDSLRRCWRFPR